MSNSNMITLFTDLNLIFFDIGLKKDRRDDKEKYGRKENSCLKEI